MTITANDMRERDYYGHLHYYYVFDMDLNANDLRLLMLVQQMQSNPDPNVKPFFSYAWMANLLGTSTRHAMRIAKKLKDKGYLMHKLSDDGKWLWKMPTKLIRGDDPNIPDDKEDMTQDVTGMTSNVTPPMTQDVTPPMTPNVTHKYNNLKANNLNTASCLSNANEQKTPLPEKPEMVAQEASKQAFVISEELDRELLRLNQPQEMYAEDNREFLLWCKYNLDIKITADTPDGKIKVLKSWIRNGGLIKPHGYDSPKSGDSTSSSDKPLNLGYGATTPGLVKRMDEKIESIAWDKVKTQKAPYDVLEAISKEASDVAKSHLKSIARAPGDLVSAEEQIATVQLTIALAALKHGQVSNIIDFKERLSDNPWYRRVQNASLVEMINHEIEDFERRA